jgi:hypothetical protein
MKIGTKARTALLTDSIVKVRAVEGRPGGHNNDKLTLTLESGRRIEIDAYSDGDIHVTLRDAPPPKRPKPVQAVRFSCESRMCNARYLVSAKVKPSGGYEVINPDDFKCHTCGNRTLIVHDWGGFHLKPGIKPPTPGHPLLLKEAQPG